MFRIAWAALVVGLIASFVSDGNSTVVLIAMVATVGLFAWALLSGRTALKCPNCGKRVKLGYSVCHHCGAQVGKPRAIGAPYFQPHEISKECPHCFTAIRPEASVCAQCQRDVPVWTLKDDTWWREEEGRWLWLNLREREPYWQLYEPGPGQFETPTATTIY